MTQAADARPRVDELAAKYLTFRLGSECGLEILKVREIIGLMHITAVPRTGIAFGGVINLRGRIIPVLELRKRFGMETIPDTEQTSIIVVDSEKEGGTSQMGILVDGVCEVLDIGADEIDPPPSFGDGVDMSFIRAVAKCRGEVKILLDTEQILSAVPRQALSGAMAPENRE